MHLRCVARHGDWRSLRRADHDLALLPPPQHPAVGLAARPCLFSRKIVEVVFSAFLIDVAMGVLTVLFNRQILKYLGTDELAVYAIQSLLRPKDPASCGRK